MERDEGVAGHAQRCGAHDGAHSEDELTSGAVRPHMCLPLDRAAGEVYTPPVVRLDPIHNQDTPWLARYASGVTSGLGEAI